jgi:hypothetical protein
MAINILTLGAAGAHSFARTNVNTEEDYIYYTNSGADVIPSVFVAGASFIYASGIGELTGLSDNDLIYITTTNPKKLEVSATAGGTAVNLTAAVPGAVTFNSPVLVDGKLNIDGSTPDNQAVKYFTNETPMTGLTSGETYFLKNVSISEFAGTQALYAFTNHTFTTAGLTGRVGPTIAQLRASYSTSWETTYLTQGAYTGYQDWTVPVSGLYTFNVLGAAGYNGTGSGAAGRGARVQGTVSLTKGEVITIAVGQRGAAPTSGTLFGGGGGGSFVIRKQTSDPILIAGGGSADANAGAGRDATLSTIAGTSTGGATAGGDPGFGGVARFGRSAAGGGFNSRGEDRAFQNTYGGGSYLDGLTAQAGSGFGGAGGFGGGGQGDANSVGQGGGGGGYSGGGGAQTTSQLHTGGGGGSFIGATVTAPGTSTGQFNGSTTINNGLTITNLASYNTGEGSVAVTLVSDFTTGNELYPTAVDSNAGTNKILLQPAGSSYHALVPINMDLEADVIHSPTPHTLTSGEAITFNFTGTPPAGLANNGVYYVNPINAYTYRLSSTPLPSFTTINLTQPSGQNVGGSSSLSRVVVNTSTETLTISNHGFLVNQPLQYSKGDAADTSIGGLQDGITYYVSQVINANQIRLKNALNSPVSIDFTSPGTGTAHSFIFLTVNAVEDTLYIPNHGLVDGQRVVYANNGNTSVAGLAQGATYFIKLVDASIIKLALTAALTTFANITGPGTGTHSLVINSLDFVNDVISAPSHGFIQGELVQYDSKGQTVVNGLTTNTPYYVIFVDGDNLKLATTPENAITGTAVDLIASPAGVGRHALQSLTNTPDGIYDVNSVPSPTTFTAIAKGNVPVIVKLVNPRVAINLTLNTVLVPSHGFSTGTKVTYSQGEAATDIEGLVDATDYFVVSVNRDYIRLASSAENAASGVTLPITGYGTGIAHTLTTSQINGNLTGSGSVTVAQGSVLVNGVGTSFAKILKVGDTFRIYPADTLKSLVFAAADVDTTNARINKTHTFVTGDVVKFAAGGGVSPSPLVDGYYYFARAISGTQLSLHQTLVEADSNLNPVDFNTQGTGTAFSLVNSIPVGPIIRRITAVGSDTQITVDRPYANPYTAVGYSFPTFVYVRPQGYSLHRPFDGGVEMSVGAGTSYGQIIRQTRKYFRYQSGKGIQTSAGINFKPSIDIESMLQFSASVVEAKTRRPHGLVSGLFVVASQAEDSFGDPSRVYNGTVQVTVVDQTTFRFNAPETIVEPRAYGFPQFYVANWTNGAVRSGMFDFQNGMFYEYDGQDIYCVRRSSTQQLAGSISALQGSELIFGDKTSFTTQLTVGDYVVLRGQSYRIVQIESDTRMAVRPEYKGSSATEKEFNPTTQVSTATDTFNIVGHGLSDKLPVVYNSIDGETIGGLVNGRTYYVDLVDNNSFKLVATPDAGSNVTLSSLGTTTVHSFVPAKSGIIGTKTVDTKIPQANWSIDPCDGSGLTGYNLDLSRIQMMYIDYSWYGAGKIRFGFKTTGGQVQYTHEFVHNNNLYESYFRSGNLPARYEVVTFENPTYIPYLFHWGTSVMMDGEFDDDNAYLFTAGSQTLNIPGTTAKAFSSGGINLVTDLFTVQSHGFRSGDILQFQSIAANGFPGPNVQNPAVQVIGSNTLPNLTNSARYQAFVNSANLIHLTPETATITVGGTIARSGSTVTVTTAAAHNIPASNNVGVYFIATAAGAAIANLPDYYVGAVNVTSATTFTFTVAGSQTVASTPIPNAAIGEILNFTTQGNTQYTYFLYPEGSLNNTSGPNYQPLLSLRLSPSVSEGLTGKLGDRDIINRMQLRLQEIGVSTDQLVDVKILLNPRLNNLNFVGVDSPSLTQVVSHTAQDTVSGGVQIYNFRASGAVGGAESTTTVNISTLFELSNSILGGDSIFPDGPDILTIAVSRLTGSSTLTAAKISWAEAQA